MLQRFPRALRWELVWQPSKDKACKPLNRAGFTGFPAVAAYWRDNLVHSHQGLIETDAYGQEIASAAALYVVKETL